MSRKRSGALPAPWQDFLRELDQALTARIELHCLGGFALMACFGSQRPTGDIDVYGILPKTANEELDRLAGQGSALHKKFKIHLQMSRVGEVAEGYEQRLLTVAAGSFKRIALLCMSAEDLVLSKLARGHPKDRHDACFLAQQGAVDLDLLKHLYAEHYRPFVLNPERADTTFGLWLEAMKETASPR